ncbi:L-aspartate oxidase [Micropruina glycogenica]|uniref:L-aspartate oxidase n=1 Tax=Micropruina glycogenica TaxID=75385 RepID=A0A2N9JJS8_9ACTN|nr:L-aspartate oxidase [Micropruina glycogenica]SPD87679.1 L-aspartate oxidase [Micropruina glycogenica]
MNQTRTEVVADGPVIIGGGLAGLSCAIELSPARCIVLSAGAISTGTSTGWAQGGVAAAVGPDDSPADHTADTLAAGAGLCDESVVRAITEAGPEAIEWLAAQGTRWDRNPDGSLKLGLEGAHGRRRIVHAGGDGTGAELLRTVVDKARTCESVSLWDHSPATRIVTEDGRVAGVEVSTPAGPVLLRTPAVVLSTGGVGGLYRHTTNPLSSRGQGLALAFRAGAVLRDVEMVQFHPTALDVAIDPMPLVSEAVRGEGAIIVNERGEWVLANPLSARDVVSRAEWAQLQAGHRVFLDARTSPGERFAELFPSINATALTAGLDPTRDLLPVRPAAHYHMGGVLVDLAGRTTVPGLYAAGEVASTGLHGANRLASNSLLEAVVCGRWVAQRLKAELGTDASVPDVAGRHWADEKWHPEEPVIDHLRGIVSTWVGVLRDAEGLQQALEDLLPYVANDTGLVGYLVARAALARTESRGAHTRTDFAGQVEARHTLLSLADLPELAEREAVPA